MSEQELPKEIGLDTDKPVRPYVAASTRDAIAFRGCCLTFGEPTGGGPYWPSVGLAGVPQGFPRQLAAEIKRRYNAHDELLEALRPLAAIADAYDANALDDEARKHWGRNDEHTNTTPPENILLYTGRGGRTLLTLADCFAARAALSKVEGKDT